MSLVKSELSKPLRSETSSGDDGPHAPFSSALAGPDIDTEGTLEQRGKVKVLFLDETWRLPPKICQFTSELFYEKRLSPRLENENLQVETSLLSGAGLWFAPVAHDGNQNVSKEEVERIAVLVAELLRPGANWRSAKSEVISLSIADVPIVAPYNSQVAALRARLPAMRIGTVDKFQGQEAPIVIVSMTSSSSEDAPRGMEFLYSLNRLNVATSRAKAACILVASPTLFEPECRTPRQMQLSNALCRYRELATVLE